MATTLESLSAADSAAFQNRLSVYGLNESAVLQSDLVVPAKTTMMLSASDAKSFLRPRLLSTSNLDELKAWVGIPDRLFGTTELNRTTITLPTSVPPAVPAELAARATLAPAALEAGSPVLAATTAEAARVALPAEHLVNLRTAAMAYIYGDSQLVAGWKTAVEQFFPNFQINFWPFFTITVNPGSILTIGPGQNVLFAWKIIIFQGGLVYAPYGSLKVESVVLQKS
jgi:hypothetical protein